MLLHYRVMAFVKRLLLCTLHCTPPIAAGLVFLVSEVCKTRPSLRDDLLQKVESLTPAGNRDSVAESSYSQLGNFDASKRDALYACAAAPSAWELSLMRLHFHPSVQAFANSFLSAETGHAISYSGDPTVDFSLSSFLNRFSYKNPKKSQVDVRRRRSQASAEDPMNLLASSANADAGDSAVAPDKMFFYKFFGDRSRLRAEGKSRNRSRHKKSEDDDDDDDDNSDLGSDFGEEAIDRFADKLADDLMQDNDDEDLDVDIDEDDDDDDDDDVDYGAEVDEDDSDGEEGRFAGAGEEDEDMDGDSGLQRWEDSDGDDVGSDVDEDGMGEGLDMEGVDSDDSALDFSDFLEKQQKKGKGGGKADKKAAKSVKTKKRKAPAGGSVFATADSFEDEMEAAVAAHRGGAAGSATSSGGGKAITHDVKRRKKSKK
jgi:ribosome biogenesis protein MAK21